MRYLAITLGHNSSALFYDSERQEVIGYEEERLTRKKNDSRFPINALRRLDRVTRGRSEGSNIILTSNWFDRFNPYDSNKYWDPSYFGSRNIHVKNVDHHEAHAWSAVAFYEEHARLIKECDIVVVDGFGNHQNCFSHFTYDPLKPEELTDQHRVYGYDCSVGLLYQWAAEMTGMDGQADVYKFLGYRTHVSPDQIRKLDAVAHEITDIYLTRILGYNAKGAPVERFANGVIDLDWFYRVKEKTIAMMTRLIPDHNNRPNVGYVVQKVLEDVILTLVNHWVPKNPGRSLLVAGGCFYNVRLNMRLAEEWDQSFCPMPVAGDQGCAFGLIRSVCPRPLGLMKSLNIGTRTFDVMPDKSFKPRVPFIILDRQSRQSLVNTIVEYINNDYIVNVVDGQSMEYGPRALCHTSTLCKPTMENVDLINKLNARNTVMPMAPVMTRAWGYKLFGESLGKIEGGEKYMIVALRYLPGVVEEYAIQGAAHLDLDGTWSGRPQIVDQRDDSLIHNVLFHGGWPCLINTSLNYHGEPIIFGPAAVKRLHETWAKKTSHFVTIWVK